MTHGTPVPEAGGPDRAGELAENLAAVRARVAAAARDCGRDPAELTIVVVTKHFPVEDVLSLMALGVRDFGENRDQEAGPKYAAARAAAQAAGEGSDATPTGLTAHFIGQLQTNKAASVAHYADVVHTVDRPKLVRALEQGAARAGRVLSVLLQADLDQVVPGQWRDTMRAEHARGGVRPEQLAELADLVAATEHLRLAGLMTVAPLGVDPDVSFARLAGLSALLRATHPQACWLSAGMSGDLEAAVRHGATHLRVGTAILGSRPPLR